MTEPRSAEEWLKYCHNAHRSWQGATGLCLLCVRIYVAQETAALQRRVEALGGKITVLRMDAQKALDADDPNGACAAYHRGTLSTLGLLEATLRGEEAR